MANFAAHAVASHAVANKGSAGAAAFAQSGQADASGFDAIFAALMAAAGGNAQNAAPNSTSKTDALAALLNGSAKHALAATSHAPAHAANQNGADPEALLAALAAPHQNKAPTAPAAANPAPQPAKAAEASGTVQPPVQPVPDAKALPQAAAADLTPGASQTKPQAETQDQSQVKFQAETPVEAQAAPPIKEKTGRGEQPVMPAMLAAALAAPASAQPAAASAATHQAVAPSAATNRQSALPGMTSTKPGAATAMLADLVALRTFAQHADQTTHAPATLKTADTAQQAPDADSKPASLPANSNTQVPPQPANAQIQGLKTALAALQTQTGTTSHATASKAANTVDKPHPATVKGAAPTPQHSAAFAAAVQTAAHRDTPAQQTASSLSPAVQSTPTPDATEAQTGDTGSHKHSGDSKGESGGTNTTAAKPAAPPAQLAQSPSAAGVHNAVASGDSSAATQANTVAQPAQAPVAANLHVVAQSAQPAATPQGVPLANLGAVAVQIAAQSKDGAKQFNIALHPAELGRIHVELSVDHSGAAQAHLRADNPQTLTLLQRDAHTLERALKDAGLNLTGNGLNFSLKGQERQNGNGAQTGGRGRSRSLSVSAVASTAAPQTAAAPIYNLAPGQVRLDIRV